MMKSNVNFFKHTVQICIVVVNGVQLPLLLNLPRWCSASRMFSLIGVPSFSVIMRRHKCSLLNRLLQSRNLFFSAQICGDNRLTSKLLKTIHKSLY